MVREMAVQGNSSYTLSYMLTSFLFRYFDPSSSVGLKKRGKSEKKNSKSNDVK
ncbi:MAG TPA: hypothetical protein VMU83_08055 [Hanamia sp.]|nr:hypothetical protein [Hanamia sp.]